MYEREFINAHTLKMFIQQIEFMYRCLYVKLLLCTTWFNVIWFLKYIFFLLIYAFVITYLEFCVFKVFLDFFDLSKSILLKFTCMYHEFYMLIYISMLIYSLQFKHIMYIHTYTCGY